MKLSVVIPAFNGLDLVLRCLNSLQALASGPCEYLVQDDESPSVFYPGLIPPQMASVERNAANLGFAGNVNAGVARATGDVLFIVNQDVQAVYGWSEHWNEALLAPFEDAAMGMVGARLLHTNGAIQSAGGVIDANCQPWHRYLNYSNPHAPEVSTPGEVSWVTGAAMAIRADLFRQLGGFDTAYVNGYWEDVDLSMKVRQAGYRIWYEPRCTLVHAVGSTGGNPNFLKNALLWKSRWVDTGFVKPEVSYVHVRYW